MIQYAQLPVPVAVAAIQQEVDALAKGWQPHFNQVQYTGAWTVLSLRSPAGQAEGIIPDLCGQQQYADTPLMDQCTAIKAFVEGLQCEKMAVRLMNLAAGAHIKEHRDHDLAVEKGEARIHIPVCTNDAVAFYVQNERINMEPGTCWYVNVNLPHKVSNGGTTDRIHLVVDCLVNDWFKDLLENAAKVEAPTPSNKEALLSMVRELRLHNTEASSKLALQIEQSLEDYKLATT